MFPCVRKVRNAALNFVKFHSTSTIQKITIKRTVSEEDVNLFAKITGDDNPIHFSKEGKPGMVHGALLNGLVSGVIGTRLPGPGTILISQELKFPNPCYIGDVISINVELLNSRKISQCFFNIVNSNNKEVLVGSARLWLNEK